MERQPLFPGTGIVAARSPWLLLAAAFAFLSQCGFSSPWPVVCGACALVSVGVVFRRLILFPAVAVFLLMIEVLGGGGDFYRWLQTLLRGVV